MIPVVVLSISQTNLAKLSAAVLNGLAPPLFSQVISSVDEKTFVLLRSLLGLFPHFVIIWTDKWEKTSPVGDSFAVLSLYYLFMPVKFSSLV